MTHLPTVLSQPLRTTSDSVFWRSLESAIEASPENSLVELPYDGNTFAGESIASLTSRLTEMSLTFAICRLRAEWLVPSLDTGALKTLTEQLETVSCHELTCTVSIWSEATARALDRAAYVLRPSGHQLSLEAHPEISEKDANLLSWASSTNLHRVQKASDDGRKDFKLLPRTRWLRVDATGSADFDVPAAVNGESPGTLQEIP